MDAEPHPPSTEDETKRSRRFASVRRGYDPSEVDVFLTSIASKIEALETAIKQKRVAAEREHVDPASSPQGGPDNGYTERMTRFGMVGVREVENMLEEAKAEAASIVEEARSEADRIKREAEDSSRGSVAEARTFLTQVELDAGEVLSGIQERRREMIEELRATQERLLSVAQELSHVVKPETDS
jgi:DivIVA domain-containing protein